MSRIPGVEIDELYAKYELHPSLIDIYVEGEFDRDWLNHFLELRGLSRDISIFTIDGVEVPNEFIAANALKLGSNKHRLIALAKLLSARLRSISTNVSCLIDADLDRLFDNLIEERHLIYTDFTCLEMYCLNDATMRKFLTLACNLKNENVEEFLQIVTQIVPSQFCVRGVNEKLELAAITPALEKGLIDKRRLGTFDSAKYVRAFIEVNKMHPKAEEIKASFDELFAKLPDDVRHKCQGHDFVESLFEYVARAGSMKLQNKGTDVTLFGGRLLASVLDSAHVFSEPLFKRIEVAARTKTCLWIAA